MKHKLLAMVLLATCAMTAFAEPKNPHFSVPEPSGMIELGACALGLGIFAWRKRKIPS